MADSAQRRNPTTGQRNLCNCTQNPNGTRNPDNLEKIAKVTKNIMCRF